MVEDTVSFWYSQWRQSCRQHTDNINFSYFEIQVHEYSNINTANNRQGDNSLMVEDTVSFWYSQWRQSCRQHTDNINFSYFEIQVHEYSNINTANNRQGDNSLMVEDTVSFWYSQWRQSCPTEGFRNDWSCRCLVTPPMTTKLSSWLCYSRYRRLLV